MTNGEIFDTDFGEIEFISPDILIVRYHKIDRLMVEHFKSVGNHRNKIIGERKYYAVSDLRDGIITIDNEAKKYLAEDPTIKDRRYLDIVIVGTWAAKLEASLYMKLFKPHVSTKVVRSVKEAIGVIEEHKKSINQ